MVRRKGNARSSNASHLPHETSKTVVLTSKKRVKQSYVLREIQHLQSTVDTLIPKAAFSRLVRSIIFDLFPALANIRIQATALEALHVAAEAYLVQLFEDSVLVTMHSKRVVLQVRDMRLVRRLRGRDEIGNK